MTLLRGRSSLQVASSSYQSPVHLYRRILRLANSLARTWDDETIYHAQRYLAQRNVKKWGEAAAAIATTGTMKAASNPGRELEPLSSTSTIHAAQYRPFMRLKSHLSLLQRAHRGGRDEMVKVLDWTYARRGVLRWAGLRPFLSKPASTEEGPAYAVRSIIKENKGNAGKPGTSYTPSHALLSLLSSPLITHSPSSNGDSSSSSSSLPSFTLPLPREGATGGHPFRKMANKHRNAAAKVIKRKLGRVRVPLGEEVVRRVEGRVRGDTEGLRGQQEAASSSKGKARSASPSKWRGPLHPDSEHFARQKRRVWAALLSRIPILPTPKGAEGEPAVQHAEEKQGRADSISPSSRSNARRGRSLYLYPTRLATSSIPGLVEAWNQRLSLTTSASAPPPSSSSPSTPNSSQSDAPARRSRSPYFIPFNLSPLSLFRTNEKRPPSVPALASQARVGALLDAERSDEDSAKKGRGEVVEGSRGSGKGKARGRATGAARRMMGSEEEARWVRMS